MCSLVKPNSIQYDRTEVLDDIPVDRQVCECTGGENDTNITDRASIASIACGTIELVGNIRDGAEKNNSEKRRLLGF